MPCAPRVQVIVKSTFIHVEPTGPDEKRMLKRMSMPNILGSMPIHWQGCSVPSTRIFDTITKHRQSGRAQAVKFEDKCMHINQHYDVAEVEEMDGQSSLSEVSSHASRVQKVEIEAKHKHIIQHYDVEEVEEMDGQRSHSEESSHAGRVQAIEVDVKHKHINQHCDNEDVEETDDQSSHGEVRSHVGRVQQSIHREVSSHAGRVQEVEVEVEQKHINQHFSFQEVEEMDGQGVHIEVSSSSQANSSSHIELTDKEIMPGASWSTGSTGHDFQNCKPCAWNWKPSGCSKGSSCEFCHLCEDGELKAKKRDRRVQARRMYQAEKRQKKVIRDQCWSHLAPPSSAPRATPLSFDAASGHPCIVGILPVLLMSGRQ